MADIDPRFEVSSEVMVEDGRVWVDFRTFKLVLDAPDALDLAKRITEAAQGLTDG